MLSIQEKTSQCNSFIFSDKFGIAAYTTLQLFKQNALGYLNISSLFGIIIEKIDKKEFKHSFPEDQIIRIDQYLVLDGIGKILMVIEGLFILIDSISQGYDFVVKNMTDYKTIQVWSTIKKIELKDYDLKSILKLPDYDKYGLTKEEEKSLGTYYSATIEAIWDYLIFLAQFYSKYNIVYNKSKHGLTFAPGVFSRTDEKKDFLHSSLTAYDHKEERTMPRGYLTTKIDNQEASKWFNVEACLNFNAKLMNEIGTAIAALEELCNYMIDNHLIFAFNCGEGYLPYRKKTNTDYSIYFLSKNEIEAKHSQNLETIKTKVLKFMNVTEFPLQLNHRYESPIAEAIQDNIITNIFIKSSQEISNDQKKNSS